MISQLKLSLFVLSFSHLVIVYHLASASISTYNLFRNETFDDRTNIDSSNSNNNSNNNNAAHANFTDDPQFVLERRRKLLETSTTITTTNTNANAGKGKFHRVKPLRILYTVTTLSEYDKGTRSTLRGFDRLMKTLVPVVKEGVVSMMASGYHVDVYIISHYEMTRKDAVLQEFPPDTDIRFWDNAAPTSYDPEKRARADAKLWYNTLGLARQHRFVVKDNLFDYDLFVNFEDDMILNGGMVDNYLSMTQTLYKLRKTAPDTVPNRQLKNFHGQLTKNQLKRCYPGLMRVEVLLDEERYGTQQQLDPVPVTQHPDIDPEPCCHLSKFASSDNRPQTPGSDKIFLWETNIIALGVRHIEELGWVSLLRGPRGRDNETGLTVADFWSGKGNYFEKNKRPAAGSFSHINNEGGWMGTRQQIWEWHTEICLGGFLPPFDSPHYNFDGLDPRNVEFWSGGLNLFTARHACNMQRLVSLDPDNFARHLIYHSANNKQRQLFGRKQSFVKINDLYGQLLTVSKDAQDAMEKSNGQ